VHDPLAPPAGRQSGPRAVLFDLYHTLVDDGPPDRRDLVTAAMARALGVDPGQFAALFRGTIRERMRGDFGDLPETLRTLAMRLGGNPAPAALRLAQVTRERDTRDRLWPTADTLAILTELRRRGLRTAVVSNCTVETPQLWAAQPMAALVDVAAFSCRIGVLKPDPAIYLWTCAELGVEPADCVFVGDGHSDELVAAAALGMRAIRTTQFADSDPTWSGESISHLAAVLGRLAGEPSH
jgi:putative hydrolase of the HAD superfamily